MKDPASEIYQRQVIAKIDAASSAFEIDVLEIIAERLGTVGHLSYSELYSLMPEDIARLQKAVSDGTRRMENVVDSVMNDMASSNDEWAKTYYQARGVIQEPAQTHSVLSQTLGANTKAVKRKVSALCRSTVVGVGDGKTFASIPEGYRRIISSAATSMTRTEYTGGINRNLSIDQAVSKAVKRLSRDGLRVQYRSGVTRNLQTAVRTNIMDAYRATMSEMREIQGKEFGADGVEVSAHALCAPDHQPYQGMQYSYERRRGYKLWEDIQNEPARPLVTGANCGHFVFPVILDISTPAYTKEELKELKKMSNEKISFEGLSGETLTMSRYEASQYQRKMETNIREFKKEAYLQDKSKDGDPKPARKAARELTKKYKAISDDMGLRPRLDLIRIFISK